MATRTTDQAVRAVIETNESTSMDTFIRTASRLTDQVVANDSGSLMSSDMLFELETYLAAYYYALFDQQYTEKETGDASAKFQGEFGKRFELNQWGQAALATDLTGFLDSAQRGKTKVGITWLGKPPSEQIDYEDRD